MERIQNIKYNKELFDKQIYFDRSLKFINGEIKKQQEKCNHINVILGYEGKIPCKKCLFCEKVMAGTNENIPTIDATTYKEELYENGTTKENRNKRLQDLRTLAISLIGDNNEITNEDLCTKLEQKVKRIKE